jgi:hypothetical protein
MGARLTMHIETPHGWRTSFEVISVWLNEIEDSSRREGDEFNLGVLMARIAQTQWMKFSKPSDGTTNALIEGYDGFKKFPTMDLHFSLHRNQKTLVTKSLLFSEVGIDSLKPRIRARVPGIADPILLDIVSILSNRTKLREAIVEETAAPLRLRPPGLERPY